MQVRVRYAPSPTGLQHIGGIRTALFNYLFARASGGRFILRIEDTDQQRFNPEALQDVYDSLDWLGISEDESPRKGGGFGPYVQSQKKEIYAKAAQDLVDSGNAYRCFCSAQRLEELRQRQQAEKSQQQGYDRHCRNLDPAVSKARAEAGEPYVIRLKTPLEGETSFDDVVLGTITRKNTDISPDPVLLKADGFPTYHLANVIDDHHMEITHILRAQEWIPSGPVHVILYKAFGWTPPIYVHLPMVMGGDGQKLSKRHGSTSLLEFREQGYLPEAIINYLALVGWSYDDSTELFSLGDLEKVFTIERLQKSPAVFDYAKLGWYNAHYMRHLTDEALLAGLIERLGGSNGENPGTAGNLNTDQVQLLSRALPLLRERLHIFSEAREVAGFLLTDFFALEAADLIPKGLDAGQTIEVLRASGDALNAELGKEISSVELEEFLRRLAEKLGRKTGQLMMPLRIALTGTKNSPPLADVILLLGRESCVRRIQNALQVLSKMELNNGGTAE